MSRSLALQPSARSKFLAQLIQASFLVFVFGHTVPLFAQVAGQSINMVTGTQWPGGDPFLERQNEPSMAVSSRNPLHLVAGNNDYRTVDLPGLATDGPTGDAWLGLFTSIDGGNLWQSVLVPGYPQDTSPDGLSSPLKPYAAGADATVRSGTNGLIFYSGLAFNRGDTGTSAVFLARYVDDNNLQGANALRYIGTSIVALGDSTHFLDKPFIAVDMPRPGSPLCTIPTSGIVPAMTIPAGRIYVAYTKFNGNESSNIAAIMLSESNDCGATWSTPLQASGTAQSNQGASLSIDPVTGNLYIVWRVFKDATHPDEMAGVALPYGSGKLTKLMENPIVPFDQGTTNLSFRTNTYPATAVDATGRLYLAWAQRGTGVITGGDAHIRMITGTPINNPAGQIKGMQFSPALQVDPFKGRGHQIMPALAFSSGKLTVAWYDFRGDDQIAVYAATGGGNYSFTEQLPVGVIPFFSTYVTDPTPPYSPSVWRQTVDVRAAQAPPSANPRFSPSILISHYDYGSPFPDPGTATILPNDPENIQQLDFDAPNLPLFSLGTVPFVGDYIDVAGPTFIPYLSGQTELWRFNNLPGDSDHTHVVWTDNRNVVQPADGNWANFTPVASTGGVSLFDPSQTVPTCIAGQTGSRNQDIYTATLSSGIVMGAKGNSKQLSTSLLREFPVTVENPGSQTLYYRLTIPAQPSTGTASFLQFPVTGLPNPLTQLTIGIPPFSSASRSVFIQSSNATATVGVTAVQTDVNNNVIPNGLTSNVTINNDISNPNISNPNISNVEIYNPNISNPNISNPNISNPNISNPNISNPNISNVTFANPNISNPNISNPNISNPNISNPNISNPNISNAAITGQITDATYSVTNSGNTAVSYAVNLLQYQPPPQGITVQLIVSGIYLTPVANGCALTVQTHSTPIANIPNPTFQTVGSVLPSGPPPALSPTFSLQPGEQALITLRVFDPTATTPAQALQDYNPVASIAPVIASQGVNTGSPAPPLNLTILAIATSLLPQAVLGAPFGVTLQTSGGSGPYTWSVAAGSLPPGIVLLNNVLSGTPTANGTYIVPLQVSDSSGQTAQRTLTLLVAPAPLIISTASLPVGQYNAPYLSTFNALGGTPPYHWSNGLVPVGMSLDPNSGILSGVPSQAGLWSVPATVTDSAIPALTQTATLPLTVGLATAYAGASNCYMPYPTTPLYYAGAVSWTLDTSSLPNPSQIYLLNGTILEGCLSGSSNPVPTGSYLLKLTARDLNNIPLQTIPLNLAVVGQDQFSNGTFFADSAGIGNLPPGGFQQGVVSPGQTFTYSPGFWGANSPGFAGNFLFGFRGGAPQFCVGALSTSVPVSLTPPPTAGRYDVLFNGTTQGCPQANSFPATPAALVIDSVDAITTVTNVANAIVSNVSVSSTNGQVQQLPNVLDFAPPQTGATIPVNLTFNYSITDPGCPNCVDQIEVGLNTDASPQGCVYSGIPGIVGVSGTASTTINVPNQAGRYYVSFDRSEDFSCLQSSTTWWTGPPRASRYIAVVDVWAP